MQLTLLISPEAREMEHVSWSETALALARLEPATCPAVVLSETASGSYIQCAGSRERLTVELREFKGEQFKHFVIGRANDKGWHEVVWDEIQCSVSPVRVHDTEVLQLEDAVVLFKCFFERIEIPTHYRMRNATRFFKHSNR